MKGEGGDQYGKRPLITVKPKLPEQVSEAERAIQAKRMVRLIVDLGCRQNGKSVLFVF